MSLRGARARPAAGHEWWQSLRAVPIIPLPMADALLYLDYNATTPVDPRVLEAMMPYFRAEAFGNPSSVHSAGRGAATAIARARKQVQELIGAEHADEVVFVSGGTESLNWAVKGVMWAAAQTNAGHRGHVITTAVEHAAVLESCKYLQGHGFSCTVVPVDREGLVDPASIVEAMRPDTVLVTIMHANNEVGTVQPVAEVARAVKARNPAVLVHTDASQSLGKVPANVRAMGVDLLSIAGHKMYAPKAIGALYVRRGVAIEKVSTLCAVCCQVTDQQVLAAGARRGSRVRSARGHGECAVHCRPGLRLLHRGEWLG